MKKSVAVLGLLLAGGSALANEGTYNLGIESSELVAPSIYGKANFVNPLVGSLILDTSDNTFYGRGTGSSNWIPLTSKVTTAASAIEVVNRAIITPGTSTCTIDSQSGTWLASPTANGIGDCSVTMSGFSATPTCVVTSYGVNGTFPRYAYYVKANPSSATALRLYHGVLDGDSAWGSGNRVGVAEKIGVICIGQQ